MKFHRFAAAITGLLVILSLQMLSAQTFIFQDQAEDRTKLGLRFLRPNPADEDNLSTFSGSYDLYINAPLSSRLNLVGSIPFNSFAAEGEDSESGIGNVYVGLQTRSDNSAEKGMNLSLSVFLPTASEEKGEAHFTGVFTNFYEFQRSLPEVLTVYSNFAYHYRQLGGGMLGVEIGPQLIIPTGQDGGDTELFGHYGLAGGVSLAKVAIFAELLGVFIVTEDVEDFGDRFEHFVDFGAQLTGSVVRPGLFYMLPLHNDFQDIIDGTLGIKVDFVLP